MKFSMNQEGRGRCGVCADCSDGIGRPAKLVELRRYREVALINTSLQRGVGGLEEISNRFSGFPLLNHSRVVVLVLLASLCSQPLALSVLAEPAPAVVTSANTAFALDLYHRQAAGSGNLFFSPYSISTALAMTYAGARGQTATEIARVLHFELPQADLPPAFATLARRMDDVGSRRQAVLSVANSLWCERTERFTDAFLKINRDCYHAEARLVDFAGALEATRKEINSWVAAKTQDKIQDLLHPDDVGRETRLVLCNAIYFKGQWVNRFDPKATQPAPFFITPGQTVPVPLMSQTLELRSRDFDDFALFALPYNGNDLSMVILLPKSVDGLPAIEQRLDGARLHEWLTALDATPEAKARVLLPKFKLNRRLGLARTLAAMGMPTAFIPGAADFSGMNGKRDLVISAVVHQAFVDVNEEGTEAAAATAVVMGRSIALQIPIFRADHPFLFFIRENQTGSLLFLGRVSDPSL